MTNCTHEREPPEEWWMDLALRLRKAVWVFADKPEVRQVFQAAEKDATNVAKLIAEAASEVPS